MKTLDKEEAIKAMANGEVVESIKNNTRYKFKKDGVLICSKNDGYTWEKSLGLLYEEFRIVKQKKKYWLWCDPRTGEVCKHLVDDSRHLLGGGVINDRYSKKLEWSEVEL